MSAQSESRPTPVAAVGILMLETRFPRIIGDVGNAKTWDFPVRYQVVRGATPEAVVQGDPRLMLEEFVTAGQALIDAGCAGITTTCGFLTLLQQDLRAALGVPVVTSSLMQLPFVQMMLPPGKRVGILTISKSSLSQAHLVAAGAPADTPIVGTEGGRSFARDILGDNVALDVTGSRLDLIDAAQTLVADHPDVGAIVMECTNMAPYAADVGRATGLPVYSIYTLVTWFQAGLTPRGFAPGL